jgi:GNAT superfamily N-acetyltransferase
MNKSISFRLAQENDAQCLSELAIRSKGYWGYSAEFMVACVDELSVSVQSINDDGFHYEIALANGEVAGFYTLEAFIGDEVELGALFVDPIYIGTGIGKALMNKAKKHAVNLGATKLNIQGDPNAEQFYLASGAVLTGSKASESIANRFLPTFQILLDR